MTEPIDILASVEDVEDLQAIVVAYIADHEDPQQVFQWARSTLAGEFQRIFDSPDPATNAAAGYWLVRSCWNATPLASNGFLPKPLPEPNDEEPCPCGSGDAYAACCLDSDGFEQIWAPTAEDMWPHLAAHHGDAYWLSAEKAGKLPALGLAHVVEQHQKKEQWRALIKLAEARLAVPRRCTEPDIAHVIERLCDAYDQLHRTQRKKLALLKRFAKHETPAIRASANGRLAYAMFGAGNEDAARAAMAEARRAEPNNPKIAMQEVLVLAINGQPDSASERAKYWRESFSDSDDVPQAALEMLDAFAKDPARVLDNLWATKAPAQVRELLGWIDRHAGRPLPRQRWRALTAVADCEPLRDAYLPVAARNQRVLEEDWLAVSGMRKPIGTRFFSGVEDECWERPEPWIDWLRRHPQAFDSLTILDDLALLLATVQDQIGGSGNHWYHNVLVRGAEMVTKNWDSEREGRLPWTLEANRPALRLLASFIRKVTKGWDDARTEPALRCYLRLNPSDHHHARCDLVNQLLARDRDAEALAYAERFPNDLFAETRYGEVLALYRLGRLDEAVTRLADAATELSWVPKYLLRSHARRPRKFRRNVVTDRELAWLYREDMRPVWMRTEGALDWLSRHARPRRR